MGYVFARYHEGLPVTSDTRIIPTFSTRFETHYVDHMSHRTTADEISAHKDRVRTTLTKSGFQNYFESVIITNDFRSAFARFFTDLAPAEHVTWYVLTKTVGEAEDFPHGGFFCSDGLPCLMVSPPTPKAGFTAEQLLEMRVCHEVTHYCLNHTLFRDDESPGSAKILEVAGETVASIVATLIGELFALLHTACFFGKDYLKLAPTSKLPDISSSYESSRDEQVVWLHEKERRYFAIQDFLFSFPWACACSLTGLHDQADAIIVNYPPDLALTARSLVKPMREIYRFAQLIPFWVVQIVQMMESADVAPYVSCWENMSKLFAAYGEDWDV